MKKILMFNLILMICLTLEAHEHWLMVNNFQPPAGESIDITLSSGHYFPKSNLGIADKLISRQVVYSEQKSENFETRIEGKQRRGSLIVQDSKDHLIQVEIKKPQLAEPQYICRLFLGNPEHMVVQKRGLEILPFKDSATSSWGFHLFFNGRPIEGSCSIFLPDGQHRYCKASPEHPQTMALPSSGTVMISAALKGSGCSLVIHFNQDQNP